MPKRIEMQNNKSDTKVWIYNFLIFIIIINGCKRSEQDILDDIYKYENLSIKTNLNMIENKEKLIFSLSILNNELNSIFIPISYFNLQCMKYVGSLIAEPKRTYIVNTIHIYPKSTNLSGPIEMDNPTIFNTMPKFIKIEPKKSLIILNKFIKYSVSNNTLINRLSDTIEYQVVNKMSIISQPKFYKVMEYLEFKENINQFVESQDSIVYTSSDTGYVINNILDSTDFKINSYQCKLINELSNNKITIKCNLERQK